MNHVKQVPFFERDELEVLVQAAMSAGVAEPGRRALLFGGIPSAFRLSLPLSNIPSDQVRHDLDALNLTAKVEGCAGPPLDIWLTNAVRIAPRAIARHLFAPFLTDLQRALDGTPPTRDPEPQSRPRLLVLQLTFGDARPAAEVIERLVDLIGDGARQLVPRAANGTTLIFEGPATTVARLVGGLRAPDAELTQCAADLGLRQVEWGTGDWLSTLSPHSAGVVAGSATHWAPALRAPRWGAMSAAAVAVAALVVVAVGLTGGPAVGDAQDGVIATVETAQQTSLAHRPDPPIAATQAVTLIPECPDGARRAGDRCVWTRVDCPPDSSRRGDACVVDAAPTCPAKTRWHAPTRTCRGVRRAVCPSGARAIGGECVKAATCPTGTIARGGACLKAATCPTGTVARGGACVKAATCPTGTIARGGACLKAATCPTGTIARGGACLGRFTCPSGSRAVNGACLGQLTCPAGSVVRGARCVPRVRLDASARPKAPKFVVRRRRVRPTLK